MRLNKMHGCLLWTIKSSIIQYVEDDLDDWDNETITAYKYKTQLSVNALYMRETMIMMIWWDVYCYIHLDLDIPEMKKNIFEEVLQL